MINDDIERASAMIVSLLANRATEATLCPSEVARALAAENRSMEWRTVMPVVHAAVDGLLVNGAVRLSWKGKPLNTRTGPYRITSGSRLHGER